MGHDWIPNHKGPFNKTPADIKWNTLGEIDSRLPKTWKHSHFAPSKAVFWTKNPWYLSWCCGIFGLAGGWQNKCETLIWHLVTSLIFSFFSSCWSIFQWFSNSTKILHTYPPKQTNVTSERCICKLFQARPGGKEGEEPNWETLQKFHTP